MIHAPPIAAPLRRVLKALMLASFAFLSVFAVSCSRRKVPEPPRARPQLLLEIFNSLSREDHMGALNKILRLKEIDKSSVFLAELENLERTNMYIVESRHLLDKGDLDGALGVIAGALKRHGAHKSLSKAHAELLTLKEMSALIDALNSPKSAAQLKESSARLGEIIGSYPPSAGLKPFVEAKLEQAVKMEGFERERMLFDLSSDADILFQGGSPEAACLLSQLAVECPKHPALGKRLGKAALNCNPRKTQSSPR